MNKGLIAGLAAAAVGLAAVLIYTWSGDASDIVESRDHQPSADVPYRPPAEPVMPPWSDEVKTPEMDKAPAVAAEKKQGKPKEKKKKTGGVLPRPNRPALPRVDVPEITPEEQQLINESFELLQTFSDFVDDGKDIEAVTEAEKWLNHPNHEVRLEVALSLDWIGLPAANQLARMIDDPHPEVKEAAQSGFWDALSESEDPYLKAELLTIAAEANDVEVRETTIDELTSLPDYISFPLLARYLNDPDEFIRQDVLDNLEFISSEEITTYEQAMAWYAANKDSLMELEADELLIPEEQQKP